MAHRTRKAVTDNGSKDRSRVSRHGFKLTVTALAVAAALASDMSAAMTAQEAKDAIGCSLTGGCNLQPSGFKESSLCLQETDPSKRLQAGTHEGGYSFTLKDGEYRTNMLSFSDNEATYNGVIILRGDDRYGENFTFGSNDYSTTQWKSTGRNAKAHLDTVVLSEATLAQSAVASNEHTDVYIRDLWIEGEAGIESYYDAKSWKANDGYLLKTLGPTFSADNVYVPENRKFYLMLRSNVRQTPDSDLTDFSTFNFSIDRLTAAKGSLINLMGEHNERVNKKEPQTHVELAIYRGSVYRSVLSPMAIDATGATLKIGSDIGMDPETLRWKEYVLTNGTTYKGQDVQTQFMEQRLVLDSGFIWLNKNIDESSHLYYYAVDFADNDVGAHVNATSHMVMTRFFGDNTFNSEHYHLYEPIFLRRARTEADDNYTNDDAGDLLGKNDDVGTDDGNGNAGSDGSDGSDGCGDHGEHVKPGLGVAVAPGVSQHFNSRKPSSSTIYRSLTMTDNDPENFVPLCFEQSALRLVGDERKGGRFDLNVENMKFSMGGENVTVKDIDDILVDERNKNPYDAKKVAVLCADSISIDPDTIVYINGRNLGDSSAEKKPYTANGSYNVHYTVRDHFEVSESDEATGHTGLDQSLYYVTGSHLFTMTDNARLNLDASGKDRFLSTTIIPLGEGEKVVRFDNHEEKRGSIEVLVKLPEAVDVEVAKNTTAKQGLTNAFGDQKFILHLEDSDSAETGATLDLNGHSYATREARINLGNNSRIVNTGTSGDPSKPVSMFLLGTGSNHVVMELKAGATATLMTNVNILHGALKLAYSKDDLPENAHPHGGATAPASYRGKGYGGLAHLNIGDGSTPASMIITGVYNYEEDNKEALSHLYMGNVQVHVRNHGSLTLGPQIGMHLDHKAFQYDLDNNENQHKDGGQIALSQGGRLHMNFNDDTPSHIYFANVMDVDDHYFLISGDGSELDQNNNVIDRITITINGKTYDNISFMTDSEIAALQSELDRILKKQLMDDGLVHMQDFTFQIRRDGIFLNAHNKDLDDVHEQLPSLDFSDVLDDYLNVSSGITEGDKDSGIFDYMEDLTENIMDPEVTDKHGSSSVEQALGESVDLNTQLGSISRLQSMQFMAMNAASQALGGRFDVRNGQRFMLPFRTQEEDPNRNLWVDVFKSAHELTATSDNAGTHGMVSDTDLYGALIGADRMFSDRLLLGAAVGFNRLETSRKDRPFSLAGEVSSELDAYIGMLYGQYDAHEHLKLSGHAAVGFGSGDFSYVNGFGMKTHGDLRMWSAQLSFRATAPFNLTDEIFMSPFAGLDYTLINTSDYDVSYNGKRYSSNSTDAINHFAAPVGFRLGAVWDLDEYGTLIPVFGAAHYRYFGDKSYSNNATYAQGFRDTTASINLLDDYLNEVSFVLNYHNGGLHVAAGCDYAKSPGYKRFGVSARIDYAF